MIMNIQNCFKIAIVFIALVALNVQCRRITVRNNCPMTVWPGIQGPGNPAGGGFRLNPGQSRDVDVGDGWSAGRIWARTGCDSNFNCETGSCGNREQCNGAGGVPPVSLAEFTLNGWGGQDVYDVSLVDGYNVKVIIEPHGNGCARAGDCSKDINSECPAALAVRGRSGKTVACKSGCLAYNTDEECCRGNFGSPDRCHASGTAHMFKDACPTAYSYAYDDRSSTLTCQAGATYTVHFC